MMNANGGGVHRLTRGCQEDYDPSWSPDGRKVAFSCVRTDQNTDVFTVSVAGNGLRSLTSNPSHDFVPAWSPDGRWLAYVGYGKRLGRRMGDAFRRHPAAHPAIHHDSAPTWAPRQS